MGLARPHASRGRAATRKLENREQFDAYHSRQLRPSRLPGLFGDVRIADTLLPLLFELLHDRTADLFVFLRAKASTPSDLG